MHPVSIALALYNIHIPNEPTKPSVWHVPPLSAILLQSGNWSVHLSDTSCEFTPELSRLDFHFVRLYVYNTVQNDDTVT